MNTPGEDRLTPDQVAGDLLARIMAGEVTTRAVLADYEQLVRENQHEITRQATRADRLAAALAWAWKHGAEALKPWDAWSELGNVQRKGYHCWGCDGEFVSAWRDGWPEPTETTFPHEAGCEYVAFLAALPPATPGAGGPGA